MIREINPRQATEGLTVSPNSLPTADAQSVLLKRMISDVDTTAWSPSQWSSSLPLFNQSYPEVIDVSSDVLMTSVAGGHKASIYGRHFYSNVYVFHWEKILDIKLS